MNANSPYELALVDMTTTPKVPLYTANCVECALATKTAHEGVMGCKRIFLSAEFYCYLVQKKVYALRHRVSGKVLTQAETAELYEQHKRECNQPD